MDCKAKSNKNMKQNEVKREKSGFCQHTDLSWSKHLAADKRSKVVLSSKWRKGRNFWIEMDFWFDIFESFSKYKFAFGRTLLSIHVTDGMFEGSGPLACLSLFSVKLWIRSNYLLQSEACFSNVWETGDIHCGKGRLLRKDIHRQSSVKTLFKLQVNNFYSVWSRGSIVTHDHR